MTTQRNDIPEGVQGESTQLSMAANLWRMLWRGKWLIVLATAIGLSAGYFEYNRRTPVYQTSAQVLVVRKRPEVLPLAEAPMYAELDDYLSTHQVLIKSPMIVKRAVEESKLQNLASFHGGDPTGAIIGGLSVTREARPDMGGYNSILNISYRGPVAADNPVILNAVIKSYQGFLEETYRNISAETVKMIHEARDILGKDLADKTRRYQEFRSKAPLLRTGKEGTTLQQDNITGVQAARSGLLLKKAELETHINTLEEALAKGTSPEALAALSPELARTVPENTKHTPPGVVEHQLMNLLVEEKALSERLGPEHPQLIELRHKIEATRKLMEQPVAVWGLGRVQNPDEAKAQAQKQAAEYVKGLKTRLENHNQMEETLTRIFNEQHTEAKKMENYVVEEEALRTELRHTQELYDLVLKRLAEVDLVKNMGGFDAKVISPPEGSVQVEPNRSSLLTVGAFFGALAGLGLAYLAELLDRTFRSPEEIRRRLRSPVVGHIPHLAALPRSGNPDSPLAASLLAHHRPRSMEAEAYRGVRTALYFSTRGHGHQVIQITSPNVADGKTTLAANLAVSIAQSGKSVLLVDADFRRPRVHKTFGQTAAVGLASVISGQAALGQAVQATEIPNLCTLPCGPVPANPAELLTSPRFQQILEELRGHYDFVLVDTPPLLAVTDPTVVAPRVDGVLLTIRISKNGRPHAERAKELLDEVGANVLGVVVNGAGERSGFGRYGHGASRYYRYTYSYYSDYADEEAVPPPRAAAAPAPVIKTRNTSPPLVSTRAPAAAGPRGGDTAVSENDILRKWEQHAGPAVTRVQEPRSSDIFSQWD